MSSALAYLINGLTTSLYILFNFYSSPSTSIAFYAMSASNFFLSAIARLVAASNSDFCFTNCLSITRWFSPRSITSMYQLTTSFSSFNCCISYFISSMILSLSSTSLTVVNPDFFDFGSLSIDKPVALVWGQLTSVFSLLFLMQFYLSSAPDLNKFKGLLSVLSPNCSLRSFLTTNFLCNSFSCFVIVVTRIF